MRRPVFRLSLSLPVWLAAGLLLVLLALLLLLGWARAELVCPPPTPLFEDRAGGFLTEGERVYSSLGYWDVEGPLNPRVVLCLTAIEDRRFFAHPGVDLRALGRALAANTLGRDRQGGSTIAMQVARLQRPAARTLLPKLVEMSTAVLLVRRFGHERVLRHYLKIVPQGNQIHGVAYAARRFFQKPLADVSLAEAALLASLPREPGRMNLFAWTGFERARKRARLILGVLLRRGQIGREEYGAALRQLERMPRLTAEARPPNSTHYILRLLEEERAAAARVGASAAYSRPLRASLDPAIQALLQTVAEDALLDNRRHEAQNVALLVADRRTGEVLGYLGSASFFDGENAGAIDYARAPRSSGSILKPFLFARGLDTGRFTPGSILADLPFAVLSPTGEYRAANFDDTYLGPMLYRRALANSRNVPALRVLEGVGLEDFHALLRRLGLAREAREAAWYGYGLVIGGLYVTLTDLVAAYGSLANDGRGFALRWRRTADGSRTADSFRTADAAAGASAEAPFSPYAAREVSLFLSDDAARLPSFPRLSALEFPFPVAIKTGTSQGYRDAWTVAYTSRYIVGIWMGNPDNRPTNHVAGIVSALYAGRVLRFLHPLQEQGIDTVPFPPPEETVTVPTCALSGERAGPDCPAASPEHFRPAEAPRAACTVHRRFAVDTRDGTVATERTPPGRVALRSYTVLRPEYALWGAQHGFGPPPPGSRPAGRAELRITYPADGASYRLDPDTPRRFQSLPLQAAVLPPVGEVEWLVDGEPLGRAAWPYALRLPLQPGTHRLQVALPGSELRSAAVTITVR